VGFGLLYKLIPLLSISSQLIPILYLEHFHIFEDSINPSILGSSCWSFPKWYINKLHAHINNKTPTCFGIISGHLQGV
jgi:hypothetical protein